MADGFAAKFSVVATNATAVGGMAAPPEVYQVYTPFLTTHAFCGIPLSDWFQILAATYVFLQVAKIIYQWRVPSRIAKAWRAIGSLFKR